MTDFKIRNAKPEDASEIAKVIQSASNIVYRGVMSDELLNQMATPEYLEVSTEKFKNRIEDQNNVSLVAVDSSGRILGFVYGGKSNEQLKTDCELHALYVRPSAQSSGIGRELMMQFAKQMKIRGAKTFGLGCLTANKSYKFYERMGGKPILETISSRENLPETYFEYSIEKLIN